MTVAVRAIVTGRVQGVAYRAWTQRTARDLGLMGWVRNLPDGSVEALVAGEPDRVAEMVKRLHDGPTFARVTGVHTEPADPSEAGAGFNILA